MPRLALAVLAIVLPLMPVAVWAQPSPYYHGWSQRFGDASTQFGYAACVDGAGSVFVTGHFAGTIDFGGGPYSGTILDGYVVKFDAMGNYVWSRQFAGPQACYSVDIEPDGAGGVVVAGYFENAVDFGGGILFPNGDRDIFIARYDANGAHLWSDHYGGFDSDRVGSMEVDDLGNIAIIGDFESSSIDFGDGAHSNAGLDDIYVASFTSTGTCRWSHTYGNDLTQYGYGIAVDPLGNVYATGGFQGAVDFGGGALNSSLGTFDMFDLELNSDGFHKRSQRFGTSGAQYGREAAALADGSLYVVAFNFGLINFGAGPHASQGDADVVLARLDPGGNGVWSQGFGSVEKDIVWDVTADAHENVFAVGYYRGTIDFGGGTVINAGDDDIFVIAYDPDGDYRWSATYGGVDYEDARGVAVDAFGNLFMVGDAESAVDFGGGVTPPAGEHDVVIVKYHSAPVIARVHDIPGDQGGQVTLAWDRSSADSPVEHAITEYTVWRAIDGAAASAALERGGTLIDTAARLNAAPTDAPVIRLEKIAGASYYWELVNTVTAHQLPAYSKTVATLFDSTSVSPQPHYFQVIAHTADPWVHYTSAPDSAYSVDNLAPAMPANLTGDRRLEPTGLELEWDANTETDLAHYVVYRGTDPSFVPGPGNLFVTTTDPTCFDGAWTWDSGYWYKVSAVDVHENESAFAVLDPNLVSDVGDTPLAVALEQNVPNPFNPSTTIAFTLRQAAAVRLDIFDASGRHVRTLVAERRDAGGYEAQWDGRDDAGCRVASGVYLYRLRAGDVTLTRKMVLLK
jgi:hypothetical protein